MIYWAEFVNDESFSYIIELFIPNYSFSTFFDGLNSSEKVLHGMCR